jgi:murein DD-endopeptidase MepM/ murein hydrolase activator NlpD
MGRRRPLDGKPRITTKFGTKGMGSFGRHLGTDYGVPVGTPIFAPCSGLVAVRKETSGKGSGGKQFELHSDDGWWDRLLHLNNFVVQQGSRVTQGQLIGYSGATGDVTGPHCHHDIRRAGTRWNESFSFYTDPEALLQDKHYETVKNGLTYYVRSKPAADGLILGVVRRGDTYETEIITGEWRKITINGKAGFVGPAAWR